MTHDISAIASVSLYMERVLKVLALSHYHVVISDDYEDIENHASIAPVEGRYIAILCLPRNWDTKSEYIRRGTLFHEALHLMLIQQEKTLQEVLLSAVTGRKYQMVWSLFRSQSEYLVDALTTAFEPLWPAWPTRTQIAKFHFIPNQDR